MTRIIATHWASPTGDLPPDTDEIKFHLLAGRQASGLGIAACGVRQQSRSEPWSVVVERDEEYLLGVETCNICFPVLDYARG